MNNLPVESLQLAYGAPFKVLGAIPDAPCRIVDKSGRVAVTFSPLFEGVAEFVCTKMNVQAFGVKKNNPDLFPEAIA